MSEEKNPKRQSHVAAMALLVTDGVMGLRPAIDALMDHEWRQHPAPEIVAQWPRGYRTARSMARLLERDGISYPEAELNVADIIVKGGPITEEAMSSAHSMIGYALGRLDQLRTRTGDDLKTAMQKQRTPEARHAPAAPQEAAEGGQHDRRQNAQPVMRQPVRRP